MNFTVSDTTVKRRRKQMGLRGSSVTTREMHPQVSEQLILDQLSKDPAQRQGVRTIQAKIAFETGQHLTR
jgi:hypothetical protein